MDFFAWFSITISFLILGGVLLYRKFDRYFGTFCLVIGAVGYFVPCIFAAPYFLVVWRMLIGRHMQTNAKLFIGRLIREQATEANSLASSDTTFHWIVAFMCNDSDSYYVAHAVGAVFSGHGKALPFKERPRESIEEKYSLHHVGWVTRKERDIHMQAVQENEPMASGYSCQEFAVDLAFQISSSRTYTFIKCFSLFRWRSILYLFLAGFSVIMFLVQNYTHLKDPVVIILPINLEFFNFVMITNLFVATEAFRLGLTNMRREKDFFGGLKDRCHVYFKVLSYMDILKLILLFLFIAGFQILVNNVMFIIGCLLIAIILAVK